MHLAAEIDVGGLGEKAEIYFVLLTWHENSGWALVKPKNPANDPPRPPSRQAIFMPA
jgi:hypothetical protein